MAEEVVKTVRIETGNAERTVKSLKKEISDLRDALLNMDKGGDEWVATAKQLTQAQEDLNSVMQAGKQTTDAAEGSIAALEQQYKALYNTYKLLSEEQRNSADGFAMRDELKQLSDNLNNVKKDVGNFKDNIGQYSNSIMDVFQKMGLSIKGLHLPLDVANLSVGNLSKSFLGLGKALLANPLFRIAALLLLVINRLKTNSEFTNRLKNTYEKLKPAIDLVKSAFDSLMGVVDLLLKPVVKLIESFGDLIAGATNAVSSYSKMQSQLEDLTTAQKNYNDALGEQKEKEDALNRAHQKTEDDTKIHEGRIAQYKKLMELTDDVTEKEIYLKAIKAEEEAYQKRHIPLLEAEKKKQDDINQTIRTYKQEIYGTVKAYELMKEGMEKLGVVYEEVDGKLKATHIPNNISSLMGDSFIDWVLNGGSGDAYDAVNEVADMLNEYNKQLDEQNKKLNEGIRHSDELQNEISQIRIDGDLAIKEADDNIKKFLKENSDKAAEFAKKMKEELDGINDKLKTNTQRELDNLKKKYDEELKILKKYHKDTAALDAQYELDRKKIENQRLRELRQNLESYRKAILDNIHEPSIKFYQESKKIAIENYKDVSDFIKKQFNLTDKDLSLDKLTDFFEKKFPDSLTKTTDELSKEEQALLDLFNSTFNLNFKTLQEIPYYLDSVDREVAVVSRNFNKYIDSVNASLLDFKKNRTNSDTIYDYIDGLSSITQTSVGFIENEGEALHKSLEDARKKSSELYGGVLEEFIKFEGSFQDFFARFKEFNFANEQEMADFFQDYSDKLDDYLDFQYQRYLEFAEQEKEINELRQNSFFDVADASFKSFQSIGNDISSTIKLFMDSEKISEKQFNKRKKMLKSLEGIQLAAAIASIVSDTTSGIMGVWKSYGEELAGNALSAAGTGPGFAAAKAALDAKSLAAAWARTGTIALNGTTALSSAIAKSIANFKGISDMQYSSGEATASGVPAVIDSNPYSYTRSLQTDVEREEELNKNYVVRVTDINDVQNRVKVVETESTF